MVVGWIGCGAGGVLGIASWVDPVDCASVWFGIGVGVSSIGIGNLSLVECCVDCYGRPEALASTAENLILWYCRSS